MSGRSFLACIALCLQQQEVVAHGGGGEAIVVVVVGRRVKVRGGQRKKKGVSVVVMISFSPSLLLSLLLHHVTDGRNINCYYVSGCSSTGRDEEAFKAFLLVSCWDHLVFWFFLLPLFMQPLSLLLHHHHSLLTHFVSLLLPCFLSL